jgi:hypothetical protein
MIALLTIFLMEIEDDEIQDSILVSMRIGCQKNEIGAYIIQKHTKVI